MKTRMQFWSLLCALFIANAAAAAEPKLFAPLTHPEGPNLYKMLFFGNSHLFVNDVSAQLSEHLRAEKGKVQIKNFASGGGYLTNERKDLARP